MVRRWTEEASSRICSELRKYGLDVVVFGCPESLASYHTDLNCS